MKPNTLVTQEGRSLARLPTNPFQIPMDSNSYLSALKYLHNIISSCLRFVLISDVVR